MQPSSRTTAFTRRRVSGSKFFPGFLHRFDHYLLLHYPVLWATRAHYFIFSSLVYGNLVMVILALLYPVQEKLYEVNDYDIRLNQSLLLESDFRIFSINFFFVCLCGIFAWLFYIKRTSPKVLSLKNFYAYVLLIGTLACNLFLFESILAKKIQIHFPQTLLDKYSGIFVHNVIQVTSQESTAQGKRNRSDYFTTINGKDYNLDKRRYDEPTDSLFRTEITKKGAAHFILLQNKDQVDIFREYTEKFRSEKLILEDSDFEPLQTLLLDNVQEIYQFPIIALRPFALSNSSEGYLRPFQVIEMAHRGKILPMTQTWKILLVLIYLFPFIAFLFFRYRFDLVIGGAIYIAASIIGGWYFFSDFFSLSDSEIITYILVGVLFPAGLYVLKFVFPIIANLKTFVKIVICLGFAMGGLVILGGYPFPWSITLSYLLLSGILLYFLFIRKRDDPQKA